MASKLLKPVLATLAAAFAMGVGAIEPVLSQSTNGLSFRWDNTKGFKELPYFLDRGIVNQQDRYMLMIRAKDLDTAAMQVTVTYPDHFTQMGARFQDTSVHLAYCDRIGSVLSRSRCNKRIPMADVVVDRENGRIDFFPETPIPAGSNVAVIIDQVFNPRNQGMFQFNVSTISPGDLPLAKYVGSWVVSIDGAGSRR
jgi:hypothetical protein